VPLLMRRLHRAYVFPLLFPASRISSKTPSPPPHQESAGNRREQRPFPLPFPQGVEKRPLGLLDSGFKSIKESPILLSWNILLQMTLFTPSPFPFFSGRSQVLKELPGGPPTFLPCREGLQETSWSLFSPSPCLQSNEEASFLDRRM